MDYLNTILYLAYQQSTIFISCSSTSLKLLTSVNQTIPKFSNNYYHQRTLMYNIGILNKTFRIHRMHWVIDIFLKTAKSLLELEIALQSSSYDNFISILRLSLHAFVTVK